MHRRVPVTVLKSPLGRWVADVSVVMSARPCKEADGFLCMASGMVHIPEADVSLQPFHMPCAVSGLKATKGFLQRQLADVYMQHFGRAEVEGSHIRTGWEPVPTCLTCDQFCGEECHAASILLYIPTCKRLQARVSKPYTQLCQRRTPV